MTELEQAVEIMDHAVENLVEDRGMLRQVQISLVEDAWKIVKQKLPKT